MLASGREYTEIFTVAIEENRAKANSHTISSFTRENQEFLVEELFNPREGRPAGKFKVNLHESNDANVVNFKHCTSLVLMSLQHVLTFTLIICNLCPQYIH